VRPATNPPDSVEAPLQVRGLHRTPEIVLHLFGQGLFPTQISKNRYPGGPEIHGFDRSFSRKAANSALRPPEHPEGSREDLGILGKQRGKREQSVWGGVLFGGPLPQVLNQGIIAGLICGGG
jgi:hypothetical protein